MLPTLVCVVLKAHGRGVPQQGAAILSPLPVHYEAWASERQAFQDGLTVWERKVDDWLSGICGEGRTDLMSKSGEEIGWVTSGGFSHFEGRGVGLGYCRIEQLYAFQIGAAGQPRGMAGLVLYSNPASTCVRVARLRVVTTLQTNLNVTYEQKLASVF